MKTRYSILAAGILFATLLFVSCTKERSGNSNGKQQVKIFLTDNPVAFQQVNVDIQRLEVKIEVKDSTGAEREFWETLQIRAGVYNILNFRNGVDTLFAQGFVTTGEIKKIRITLGTRNSVMADSVVYPLLLKKPQVIIDVDDISSIDPSAVKINIDFDACGSIIKINNNQFELQPRIRTFSDDHDGRIEGKVLPRDAAAIVSVISNGDTLLAIPEDDGEFKIRGIKTAVVDVFVNATANGYRDTTLRNVTLNGREVKLPTIILQK